jgi:RNA polymerase sigma-70 factor (sigma-E family)
MGVTGDSDSDADGFRDFVAARQASLLRSAWLLTGDRNQAEDLLQTALANVWRHWTRISRHGTPEAYVRKSMVNVHISWWRRRNLVDIAPGIPMADALLEAVELRSELMAALRGLPPRQRAVIVLRYYEDLSEAETAAVLDCTVGTVKSQCHKGLAKLRDLYLESQPMGSDQT